MENMIIIAILAAILGFVVWYLIRAKKRGQKCIGCPSGGCNCSGESSNSCGCGCSGCGSAEE